VGVVEAYSDPAIQKWHVRSMTEDEALGWVTSWAERWAAETGASWAILENDTLVGRTGFNALDLTAGLGEAAYWVLPAARGREVAPRALRATTAWMFAEVGLHPHRAAAFGRQRGLLPCRTQGRLSARGHQARALALR
jgi:RimJ/RimL family protein N-acetyltransferase